MTDRDKRFLDVLENMQYETPPATPVEPPIDDSQLLKVTIDGQQKDKLITRMKNKLHKMNLVASFAENPANVSVQSQEPNEHILLFLRKSQWLNSMWGFSTVVLAFLPIVLYVMRDTIAPYLPPLKIILVCIPLYYIFVAIYAFLHFITWYYNAAIITNKRIIDIDFHQLVMKDVAETKMNLVQDVSYSQEGVFPNMFGYGKVLVQTAGTLDNFEFFHLPQPARVVEIIEGLIGRRRFP